VCVENFIRFDCVRESHSVGDYGYAALLLSGAVGLAVSEQGARLGIVALKIDDRICGSSAACAVLLDVGCANDV
jgi:hypothetical protein